MRSDQRDPPVSTRRMWDGHITQRERQMLSAVDETVEAENPSLRDIPVGEP
jgi:hypothetical protein